MGIIRSVVKNIARWYSEEEDDKKQARTTSALERAGVMEQEVSDVIASYRAAEMALNIGVKHAATRRERL